MIKKISQAKNCEQEVSALSGESVIIAVNNGHLKAIREIKEIYNLKSEEDALQFAIAIMIEAKNKEIVLRDKDGEVTIGPGEGILNKQ